MAKDLTLTRRAKIAARLVEQGGSEGMATLHEWSSLKLLCGHQAFSQLMEGMVDEGLVRWDGTAFSLTDEGRELAAQAPVKTRAASAPAVEAPAADPDHDHGRGHDHGEEHDHRHDHGRDPDHVHVHDHGGDHDHVHDHGGDHGHSHRHDRYGDGREMDLPKPPRPTPRAAAPPPAPERKGLRAKVKGVLKGWLGRG